MTDLSTTERSTPKFDDIGNVSASIPVELSARFLEHFSEQLYSSPQKAFEELISNGWDAGADYVDVRISNNLADPNATMSVLDNGTSMDEDGLRTLWHIAFSPKKNKSTQHGRQIIGKFGIGKLATYVLADKLTYICKANDGKIRRVTMNYGEIDDQKNTTSEKLISELSLDIFEVTEDEVTNALASVYDGQNILQLIQNRFPKPTDDLGYDEFASPKSTLIRPHADTWTLVILSSLKETGRRLKIGVLRRMLKAALPIGTEMAIQINGQLLKSSKVEMQCIKEWTIGPDLDIKSIDINDDSVDFSSHAASSKVAGSTSPIRNQTTIPIESENAPVPHVSIPSIGMVTGRAWLFVDRITGGRSDERGASNGFHINVCGRVVNQTDPSFGEENLSHAAWARFRLAVRADGLNEYLTTDREKFRETQEIRVFRAFLRRIFNMVRQYHDSDENAAMPHGGDILVESLGVISLSPLKNIVSEVLKSQSPLPDLFDENGITDRDEKWKSWRENTSENIRNALGEVKYEKLHDNSFVKFRIVDNTIVVNKDHPFVAEHSRTKAEKELLRTIAMVNLLSDVYALDVGVQPYLLGNIRNYRDQLMRFRALQSRRSGTHIAKLLHETQHDSKNSKHLEKVLSDALRYIGFEVSELGGKGVPEGIARAYPTPTFSTPSRENPNPPLYSFTYDAKSTKHESAPTGNISLDAIAEHRDRYAADHALVVAPGFRDGAIAVRCEQQKVTPMKASDLGQLLEYTVEYGAIPLNKIREVFELYDPASVSQWVIELKSWLKDIRSLTIHIFLNAIDRLRKKGVPDVLAASTIAMECRNELGAYGVKQEHVIDVAKGLAILIPDLIAVFNNDKIVVNASIDRVAAAVETQLDQLHHKPSADDS